MACVSSHYMNESLKDQFNAQSKIQYTIQLLKTYSINNFFFNTEHHETGTKIMLKNGRRHLSVFQICKPAQYILRYTGNIAQPICYT